MKAAVVIPIFNQEKYLRRCLDSLSAQTCRDFVAVCVDDGSTDASADILRRRAEADSRFRIVSRPNGGVSSARNAGLAAALSDTDVTHVMFLDADDAYLPDCVEAALSAASDASDAVIEWDWSGRAVIRSPNVWCKCYPRFCVEDVRFFEGTDVAEDIAFNIEVFYRHRPRLVHLARRLYDYSENPVSAMHRALTADDFRRRMALIEYLVALPGDDKAALNELVRTEIPDLLRQFYRHMRRLRPDEEPVVRGLFQFELASLRRRGLLRPRRGGLAGWRDHMRWLLLARRADPLSVRYDHVISFGSTCGCAMYLVRHGLRSCSLPFDWIGTWRIGLSGTVDIVGGGFKSFFGPETTVPMTPPDPEAAQRQQTAWVADTVSRLVSAHDFRKGIPLADQFDGVMGKFRRRQRRLLDILREPSKKLVIYRDTGGNEDDATIAASADRLRRAFPSGTTNVVYLRNAVGFDGLRRRDLAPGVVVFDGWFHRPEMHVSMGDVALNNRVFSRIRAHGRQWNLLRNKLVAYHRRLKTQLHFSAAARRAAREAYRSRAWETV